MTDFTARFDAVRPRDVELLVLEELTVEPAVRSWVLERARVAGSASPELLESRDTIAGENDGDRPVGVEAALETAGERRSLCVAVAFESDLERVATRLASTGTDRDADATARTVLLAPGATLENTLPTDEGAIDATIALESLRDRLAERDAARDAVRTALVDAAIRTGTAASSVLDRYREFAADTVLEVSPAEQPGGGTAVAIDAPRMAPDHRLVHDLAAGAVDLRIPDGASRLRAFAARYASAIPPTANLLAEGDALVLRVSVPAVDPAEPTPDAAIEDALEAADELRPVSELVRERSG